MALQLEHDRLRVLNLFLFAGYFDSAVVFSSRIDKWLDQSLILGCHNLVKLKLKVTDVLLFLEVVRARIIVHVIGLHVKVLRLFEIVIQVKVSHKVRVEIVVDAFCAPSKLLNGSVALLFEFVQKNECICF